MNISSSSMYFSPICCHFWLFANSHILFQLAKSDITSVRYLQVRIDFRFTDNSSNFFQHGVFTTVHKYYSVDEWKTFAAENPEVMENVALSCGTGEEDYKKFQQILAAVPGINTLCLDVANGYSQSFVDFVRKVREAYPGHTIIVSS